MISSAINVVLVEEYKRENKIPSCVKLGTYGYWVRHGYKPKKGNPARHRLKLWTKKGLIDCWLWTDKEIEKL